MPPPVVQAAAPRHISKRVDWATAACGVVLEPGGKRFTSLLTMRRAGDPVGQSWIEDLGSHSQPWFAGVCHDIMFLKAAFDAGELADLDRAARAPWAAGAAAAPKERRLNFPLSSYIHQQPFWAAMERNSFGQIAVQLRCGRELAKTLFFGDAWDEGLPRKRQQQFLQAGGSREGPAVSDAAADEQRAARKRLRTQSEDAPAAPPAQHQQQKEQHKRATSVRGEAVAPSSLPQTASAAAAARAAEGSSAESSGSEDEPLLAGRRSAPHPAQIQRQKEKLRGRVASMADTSSSNSEDDEPVLGRSGQSPAVAGAAEADSPPRAGKQPGKALSRRVVKDSDSDSEVAERSQPAAAAAAAAAAPPPDAAAGLSRWVVSSSDDDVLLVGSRAGKAPAAAAAGTPPRAATAAGARPSEKEEPRVVWLKEGEFPAGSGKFPMYLKSGPIQKAYYTVNKEAGTVLLDEGYQGDLHLQDAATGRRWTVNTNLKGGSQRYLTKTSAFNKDNNLQAHDVLWLQRGPDPSMLLFGVWRWGSQEAADFAAKLQGGKGAKRKSPGPVGAAGASPPGSVTRRAAKALVGDDE